ncbi:YihY/virulence factor BrkB family protein [Solirubrobacter soli]|uniref:YihY/virulence factor BrkB family protein n=1 Tax=Solirubrobacter soli TaxID=363832 RepID=UPI0003F730B7|nr:YihY/virulence factor BrkB family protein [Solirubrobacter soli]
MAGRLVEALDGYQRKRRWLGFPLAVIYKFADDQGSYLAALIAYYGFLSLFPLLLLLVTILGFVLEGDPKLQADLLDSALAQFPVIGSQLRDNVRALSGSGAGLVVGVLLTIYGCLGVAGAVQNAFNRAWAVPRNRRPNPVTARLRSLLLLPVLGAGLLVTTALAGLTTGAGTYGADIGGAVPIVVILLALVANIGQFMLVFRVLTAREVPTRDLRVGAVVAGVGWQLVQILGTYLVTHMLRGTNEAYGVFGLVLGLIAWIYVLSLVTVLAAEVNVVAQRRLWPRALLTPFTDDVRLTAADERAYAAYAGSEQHKGFEVIDVGFEPPVPESAGEPDR